MIRSGLWQAIAFYLVVVLAFLGVTVEPYVDRLEFGEQLIRLWRTG